MVIVQLHEKQAYEIQFNSNDGDPSDLYVILTGWVTTGGGGPVPPDTDNQIGPGAFCRIPGTAPSTADASRLRIEVSVPHPNGGGTLIVTQGAAHQTLALTDDGMFLSPLVP